MANYFRNQGFVVITAAVFVCFIAPSFAQSVKDCIGIENDLDRLACYDRSSGRIPKSVATSGPGAWTIRTEVSKLKDTEDVFLHVDSRESIECRFGRGGKVRLVVRCMENTTAALFVTPNCHMASSQYNDYGHVDYRVDDEKARTARMEESTDNKALGYWRGRKAIPFAKSMFGGSELIARMTPYSESSFTVTFDITGLENAIKPLRASCQW